MTSSADHREHRKTENMKRLVFITTKYVVEDGDTVEKLAARFDCTPSQLMKLNKLHSRVLFSGQSIFVPDGETLVEEDTSTSASFSESSDFRKKSAEVRSSPNPAATTMEDVAAELDAECVQKFLKINTDEITKSDGRVPGVLIITPNCVMFDPDMSHPTVVENGQDKYGLVAPNDVIVSIGLYEGALVNENAEPAKDGEDAEDPSILSALSKISHQPRKRTASEEYWSQIEDDDVHALPGTNATAAGSAPAATAVAPMSPVMQRRRASTSDLTLDLQQLRMLQQFSAASKPEPAEPSQSHSLTPTPKSQRRGSLSFGLKSSSPVRKLSGLLRKRPDTSSKPGESAIAEGVSTENKKHSIAGVPPPAEITLEFNERWYRSAPGPDEDPTAVDDEIAANDVLRKQKENYETFQLLKRKTEELRKNLTYFYTMGKGDRKTSGGSVNNGTAPPFQFPFVHDLSSPKFYYLRICLDERRRKKEITKNAGLYDFGDKSRNEFLFLVPAEKIDFLYLLFLQWSAGDKPEDSDVLGSSDDGKLHDDVGFVVIDDPLQRCQCDEDSELLEPLNLTFRWEIVSIFEIKKRLSLSQITEASFLPLPEGTDQSSILNELTVRRIVSFLPARAQGYPWVIIYSSESHGFSLATMYRNMHRWRDNMSPVLLVIKDSQHRVFGAILNCVLRVSEHFYGSGESLLFSIYPELHVYRWTGVNNFIVKGNADSLVIGSGHGSFGLYLDADLYHGRTQHCDTFDNEPLTSSEDFIISGVEAFGFSMTF